MIQFVCLFPLSLQFLEFADFLDGYESLNSFGVLLIFFENVHWQQPRKPIHFASRDRKNQTIL